MPPAKLIVAKDHALTFLTLLTVLTILGSYALNILLAGLCLLLPLLLIFKGPGVWEIILLVFGGVAGTSILWSLVPRRFEFKAPGVLLDLSQHPKLAAQIQSVALALGEPMPREIYLIAMPNAFVTNCRTQSGRERRRVLGLGLPLMASMTVSEFRAVLAHEFAHFYTGDTRLGPWVYKSRASMARVLTNLSTGTVSDILKSLAKIGILGIAYTVVIGGIALYWQLFLRVTTILSRRQEFRSDELACRIGGSAAFQHALQIINSASITFPLFWKVEVGPLLAGGYHPPIAEGFMSFLKAPAIKVQTDRLLDKKMKETRSSPLDTHPPLAARVRRASAIPDIGGAQDLEFATSLFDDLAAVEKQLIAFLAPTIQGNALKPLDWSNAGDAVYLPGWMMSVRQHPHILGESRIADLPELIQSLKKSPPNLPNPPGMLLSREQREERVNAVLWMAMSLSLISAGWQLHRMPGQHWIGLENRRIEVPTMITGLRSGRTSPDQWRTLCTSLGIAELRLNPILN